MKYVPLDEVERLIQSKLVNTDWWTDLTRQNIRYKEILSEIKSLKTIDLSIIDEMIQENLEYPENDHNLWYRSSIKELKERLSLNK